ncbi:MAG: sialate O-acetylesterase [Chthonomonadales bacterium]
MRLTIPLLMCTILATRVTSIADTRAKPRPLKVFILAGQSNMEGQAVVDLDGKDYNEGRGTLKALLADPISRPRYRHLVNPDGSWATQDNVWVRYKKEDGTLKAGPLGFGFTPYGDKHHFGPELQFGHVIGSSTTYPVLIIKTAWGGKSLYKDFRPPSSGGETGFYYKKMLDDIQEALFFIQRDFPEIKSDGYQLAGFVWYQGWNDGVDPQHAIPEYEQNLVNLIHDIRKDLKSPNLPVVVGELTGPWVVAPPEWTKLRQAQKVATERNEFKGNVLFVPTHAFVRLPADSPNPTHGHHEFGNAETYFLVGDALGHAMNKLLGWKSVR